MKPTIYVFNKIDALNEEEKALFEDTAEPPADHPYPNRKKLLEMFKVFQPTFVSASHKQGLQQLKETIAAALYPELQSPSATSVLTVIKELKHHRHTKNFIEKKREKSEE